MSLFSVNKPLEPRSRKLVTISSFVLPILIWCLVSYVPFIWHPEVEITTPGSVNYFREGMLVDKTVFNAERDKASAAGKAIPEGIPANPIYLPAPHEVLTAFYTSFTTEPKRSSELWLHESLWSSIQVIFYGFLLSSIIGIPLGVLAGTYDFFSRLFEPFIEFFRYLPAPAFGALAVAILGIYQAPKIAIIFIGTFFQQVLIVANTTRKLDPALLEAGQTLGANNRSMLFRIVLPGILPDLYRDTRILLGWAWTYLIVAELIGTSSGITWFITQQARYKNFDNVFAAIMMIGILGLTIDLLLAWFGRRLFPWQKAN
ncbi:ABC-type nitrate/sulfonate/bicarbonate transport system, permease component [Methylophaga aminisulfidivorans MP]|jgi:NitT/TauT family transport system permease protein|uniref:ABC-type nitrate/sulfonate/bicarbonate transport system, permease component n=1 Tax=Methylophaga aminisulfidivorans MP TaxID=1026882 RepID=F5T164_9GAMM|nr:ABC transporter permease [Methylophaga aminisulfidivorans]EGL53768.1 ABC-type nitrate/sulfonate/bicarbonate transport system, permease component [Methylophaga aminisulfidivorans MP]